MRVRVPPIVLLVLGTIACGGSPWAAKDAPKTPPDEQFRTGVEVGYDAWIWHCYEGQRIVITQSGSAGFGTSAPRRSTGPCGAPLASERGFSKENEGRQEIPDSYRWPGSRPAPPKPPEAKPVRAPDADVLEAGTTVQPPPPALEPVDAALASPSLEILCRDFLVKARRDGEEIAKTFSFQQIAPRCRLGKVPAAFVPSSVFLDARTIDVAYVSREESRLALKLARGWVLTPVAWSVRERESATPPWGAQAPERVTATGSEIVVYLGGEQRGLANGYRELLGAHACRDQPPDLTCWRWDPTEQEPLATKEAASAALASKLPWKDARTLVFGDRGVPVVSARP